MCLILVRKPEVQLDYEKIKNACLNNPHGWGYIIPDRGKLEIRRFFNPKGNDPDQVYDVLDSNLDKQIFLHLRFCTAGEKNKANVHPFPALQSRRDGMQVWLMHNGTVNEYKPVGSSESDTYHFTQKVVSPLLKRVMSYTGKKMLLHDPFIDTVITKFANNWSKWVLVDQYGNYRIIGESDAKEQEEGYWVSNDYSFRSSYRTPAKTQTSSSYNYGGSWKNFNSYPNYGAPYYGNTDIEDAEYEDIDKKPRSQCAVPFSASSTTTNQPTSTSQVPSTTQTNPNPQEEKEPLELEDKTKFLELLGMNSLFDLTSLTEADLLDMVSEYPEIMAVCIRDLLEALYNDK